MAKSWVTPVHILRHHSSATTVFPQCNLSSLWIFNGLSAGVLSDEPKQAEGWCWGGDDDDEEDDVLGKGLGFGKPRNTCPSWPGMDQLWDGEEIEVLHSVQPQTKGDHNAKRLKNWILHFYLLFFLFVSLGWMFWRLSKFLRQWLNVTLDGGIQSSSSLNHLWKAKKVLVTSEGPSATLEGGTSHQCHKLRENEEQLLADFIFLFAAQTWQCGVKTLSWGQRWRENPEKTEKNAFWGVDRFEGAGVKAWEGGGDDHRGWLSRKTAKVSGFV